MHFTKLFFLVVITASSLVHHKLSVITAARLALDQAFLVISTFSVIYCQVSVVITTSHLVCCQAHFAMTTSPLVLYQASVVTRGTHYVLQPRRNNDITTLFFYITS